MRPGLDIPESQQRAGRKIDGPGELHLAGVNVNVAPVLGQLETLLLFERSAEGVAVPDERMLAFNDVAGAIGAAFAAIGEDDRDIGDIENADDLGSSQQGGVGRVLPADRVLLDALGHFGEFGAVALHAALIVGDQQLD